MTCVPGPRIVRHGTVGTPLFLAAPEFAAFVGCLRTIGCELDLLDSVVLDRLDRRCQQTSNSRPQPCFGLCQLSPCSHGRRNAQTVQTAGAKGYVPLPRFRSSCYTVGGTFSWLVPIFLSCTPGRQTKANDTHWLDLAKLLRFLASLAHGAIQHSSPPHSRWLGSFSCLTRLGSI